MKPKKIFKHLECGLILRPNFKISIVSYCGTFDNSYIIAMYKHTLAYWANYSVNRANLSAS